MTVRDPDLNDYLDANATWRRTLSLRVKTPELLRVGTNRVQRRRQDELLAEARSQLRETMEKNRRRAFRGVVSVELDIHIPGGSEAPSAPKSVKRYLDALAGIAYADDRQLGHLVVRRFAPDHPWARGQVRAAHEPGEAASVHMLITPLRLYVADYDRVFAHRAELMHGDDHPQLA